MRPENCLHRNKKEDWEDHILLGNIFYGWICKDCGKHIPSPPGPLELGTYR